MFSTSDTIVAIATPSGRGGLGIVRLSGPDAHGIAQALFERPRALSPRQATVVRLSVGALSERAVVTYFPKPHSYTAEDTVELSAHGSPVTLQHIVGEAVAHGARLARPGEFTFRAFIHGRIDLPQAEAVADLVDAMTPLQARVAHAQLDGSLTHALSTLDASVLNLIARLEASIDFPDEGYHFIESPEVVRELEAMRDGIERLLATAGSGCLLRTGARVVVSGRPNVGKSSIFNSLCGVARAIVAAQPGTTRDLITESIDLNGTPITLVDTAGVREAADDAEREGVRRAATAAAAADLVLVVLDRSQPLTPADLDVLERSSAAHRVIAANKSDLPAAWPLSSFGASATALEVSAVTGRGIAELVRELSHRLGTPSETWEGPLLTSQRHADLLRRCLSAVSRAAEIAHARGAEELILVDLNEALRALDEIAGRRTPDDVLEHVFARFCIGK